MIAVKVWCNQPPYYISQGEWKIASSCDCACSSSQSASVSLFRRKGPRLARLGFSFECEKVIGGRYFPIARAGQVRVASRVQINVGRFA